MKNTYGTNNFLRCKEEVGKLGITNLVKAYDYIHTLSQFIPGDNEVLDDLRDIKRPLEEVICNCKTNKVCPHCGAELFMTDLPQYDYVCVDCDENFYECEVK